MENTGKAGKGSIKENKINIGGTIVIFQKQYLKNSQGTTLLTTSNSDYDEAEGKEPLCPAQLGMHFK